MNKSYLIIITIFPLLNVAFSQDTYANVASRVFFQVHSINGRFNLTSNIAVAKQACPDNSALSWVIHGWLEGFYTTEWVPLVVNSTLKNAGGCVIFMDYSYYSKQDYGAIVSRYEKLRDVLINTVKLFGNYSRMHFFGFSFGSRLAIGCGNNITALHNGTKVISRMDLCDPAGPEFDYNARFVPSKNSAKNVACINTSNGYGTKIYDCHQNFKMGRCGSFQDAQGPYPKGSHGLCPYFYDLAFKYNYTYNPIFRTDCASNRQVNATCQQNMIMGYRNRLFCEGDILIPTAKCSPYVYNGTVNNFPVGKTTC